VSEASGLSGQAEEVENALKGKHDNGTIIEKKPYGTARTVGL
jgi:hypothetical protein